MEISLNGGFVAVVDDEDACLVEGFKWHAARHGNVVYVRANHREGGRRTLVSMHRVILGAAKSAIIDHIDGDGLNNRRSNLRLCNHTQNIRNQRKQADCMSPFKGVRLSESRRQRFYAEIQCNKEKLKLGPFSSEHKAARAYDAAARLFFGRFAKTNADLGLYALYPDRGA